MDRGTTQIILNVFLMFEIITTFLCVWSIVQWMIEKRRAIHFKQAMNTYKRLYQVNDEEPVDVGV